jgi:dTDP-4-amino-4,6-dideoxygalactose transaminase
LRYDATAFCGASREQFILALQAEGIPCSAGYMPLYREKAFQAHFAKYPFDSPYFKGKPDYGRIHCPQTERICTSEAIWLPQNLLLGTATDMQDIVQAIAKIQRYCAELPAI